MVLSNGYSGPLWLHAELILRVNNVIIAYMVMGGSPSWRFRAALEVHPPDDVSARVGALATAVNVPEIMYSAKL